jgi:hypothetical protein
VRQLERSDENDARLRSRKTGRTCSKPFAGRDRRLLIHVSPQPPTPFADRRARWNRLRPLPQLSACRHHAWSIFSSSRSARRCDRSRRGGGFEQPPRRCPGDPISPKLRTRPDFAIKPTSPGLSGNGSEARPRSSFHPVFRSTFCVTPNRPPRLTRQRPGRHVRRRCSAPTAPAPFPRRSADASMPACVARRSQTPRRCWPRRHVEARAMPQAFDHAAFAASLGHREAEMWTAL